MSDDEPPIVWQTRAFLEECDRTPTQLVYPTKALYNQMIAHADDSGGRTPTFDGIAIGHTDASEPLAVFREEVPING